MALTTQIRVHVDVPQFVEFSTGEVTIPIRCALENLAENEFALAAKSEDEAVFWHVLNDQHREIARKPKSGDGGGEEAIHSVTVATAHPSHEAFDVTVDAKKLRSGRAFTVRVETYGHTAEGQFVAVQVPSPEELAAAESSASKSSRKKKATKRKRTGKAKKKAAKKKAAKKKAPKKKAARKKRPRTAKKRVARKVVSKATRKAAAKKSAKKKGATRATAKKKAARKRAAR